MIRSNDRFLALSMFTSGSNMSFVEKAFLLSKEPPVMFGDWRTQRAMRKHWYRCNLIEWAWMQVIPRNAIMYSRDRQSLLREIAAHMKILNGEALKGSIVWKRKGKKLFIGNTTVHFRVAGCRPSQAVIKTGGMPAKQTFAEHIAEDAIKLCKHTTEWVEENPYMPQGYKDRLKEGFIHDDNEFIKTYIEGDWSGVESKIRNEQ